MNQVQTETTALEAAAKEHRALRDTLRDLGQFLEENPLTSDASGSSMASRLLRARLSTLFVTLERHFREEEESGLPEILRVGPPQIEDCVAELRLQHARILSELRALIAATERFADEGSPFDLHLREWTERVLEHVSRHEIAESVRLDSVYGEEEEKEEEVERGA